MNVKVSRGEIANAFRKCLNPGDDVLIHASLSAIGWIEGGADGCRDSILEAIGPEGTALMLSSSREEFVRSGVFDVRNTPSDVGALGESFRKHPSAKRSICPMVSFVGIGKRSSQYTKVYDSYLDEGSPIRALLDNNGKILLFGIGYAKCTLYHLSEEKCRVDYNYYKEFSGTIIDWEGKQQKGKQRYFVRKSMETKKDAGRAGSLFEQEHDVVKLKVGKGVIRSFSAVAFDSFCTAKLEAEPNLFLAD